MAFVLDTCVWIDVERGALAPGDVSVLTQSELVFISPVTLAELRFGAEIAPDPGTRQKRLAALRRLERKPLLVIDGTTGMAPPEAFSAASPPRLRRPAGSTVTAYKTSGSPVRPCNTPAVC
ncbi:MAG: hypothetical protein ACLQOO_36470 [Terriglobia bacterium]